MTHAYALITLAVLAVAVPFIQRHAASRRRLRQALALRQEDVRSAFNPEGSPEVLVDRYVFAAFQLVCKGLARPPARPDNQAAESDDRQLDFFLITGEQARRQLIKARQQALDRLTDMEEPEFGQAVRQLKEAVDGLRRATRELERRIPDRPVDPAGIRHAQAIWKDGFPGLYGRLISKWYAENANHARVPSPASSEPTIILGTPAPETIILGPAARPSDATIVLGRPQPEESPLLNAAECGESISLRPREDARNGELTDTFLRALQEAPEERKESTA
jgi:hypothetical protein